MMEGYSFRQTTSDTRYWHCAKKLKKRCSARLRFDLSGNLKFFHRIHNHGPEPNEVLPECELPPSLANSKDATLTIDGYQFLCSTQSGRGKWKKAFWQCSMAGILGCQATIVTKGDRIKIGTDPHNHNELVAVTEPH